MNAAYQIHIPSTSEVDANRCNLYIEIAKDHLSFALFNIDNQQFVCLQYFVLEPYHTFNKCKEIIYHNDLLSRSYNRVVVLYQFPECNVTPAALYKDAVSADALQLINGDFISSNLMTDQVKEWGVINVYGVQPELHQLLKAHFNNPQFYHGYTSFLKWKKLTPLSDEDEIVAIFSNSKLFVAVFRGGNPFLLQFFDYETAEDVTYHLLNIATQFSINCETVQVKLSGLLDVQSSVYAEIEKYFLHVGVDQKLPGYRLTEEFKQYPEHFFVTLYNSALCEL